VSTLSREPRISPDVRRPSSARVFFRIRLALRGLSGLASTHAANRHGRSLNLLDPLFSWSYNLLCQQLFIVKPLQVAPRGVAVVLNSTMDFVDTSLNACLECALIHKTSRK